MRSYVWGGLLSGRHRETAVLLTLHCSVQTHREPSALEAGSPELRWGRHLEDTASAACLNARLHFVQSC